MFEVCHAIALGLDKRTILDDTDCDARQMLSLQLIPDEALMRSRGDSRSA